MKKYKLMVSGFCLLYVVLSIGLYFCFQKEKDDLGKLYIVEANRIETAVMDSISEIQGVSNEFSVLGWSERKFIRNVLQQEFKKQHPESIKQVSYLPADEMEVPGYFWITDSQYRSYATPLYDDDRNLLGIIKYDYIINEQKGNSLLGGEVCLFLMFVLCIGLLVYVRKKIIAPFHALSEMPYELAKGNLKNELPESENRFFGKFIWGINMLRETLEAHREKELKFVRDKKMILLSISHDILTPLNAINLYAQAMKDGMYEGEEEQREAAVKISEKAQEIDDFVKEIMKSATEEIVSIEVADSEFYLGTLVDKISNGYSEKLALHKVDLIMEAWEDVLIRGDIDRVYEAVGNLIQNALKYGDEKEIRISFSQEEACQLIHVFNTGVPVEEREMPHLFDSFFRGSNAGACSGNGLGLYICSQIMHKMNGEIYAQRRQEGMEFVLVCPLC